MMNSQTPSPPGPTPAESTQKDSKLTPDQKLDRKISQDQPMIIEGGSSED